MKSDIPVEKVGSSHHLLVTFSRYFVAESATYTLLPPALKIDSLPCS